MPAGVARSEGQLVPFDIDTSVPENVARWKGYSGTVLADEHGRSVALVVRAQPGRSQRRLLVLPVAAIVTDPSFVEAAGRLGLDPVVEDFAAPIWAANTASGSLTASGTPIRVCEAESLALLGVQAAVAAGHALYPAYVPRARDDDVSAALTEAANGGRRLVVILGDSAAGKSRTAAEAILRHQALKERELIVPRGRGLSRLFAAGLPLENAVVWLDDLDKLLGGGLETEDVEHLLELEAVVAVATSRTGLLRDRSEHDPVRRLLTDSTKTIRVALAAELNTTEAANAEMLIDDVALLAAIQRGAGLGEYLVGGPKLVETLKLTEGYERHLADVLISWHRAGLVAPISSKRLRRLWVETLPGRLGQRLRDLDRDDQKRAFAQALAKLCEPLMSRDGYDVALARPERGGYEPDDFVVDHVSKDPLRPPIAEAVWHAALRVARDKKSGGDERLWGVAAAAYGEKRFDVALSAARALSKRGYLAAIELEGNVLTRMNRGDEAISAYDQLLKYTNAVAQAFPFMGDEAMLEKVANALFKKGATLGELGNSTEELAVYEDVIGRFGNVPSNAVATQVAGAMYNKSVRLGELERFEEAVIAGRELVTRYRAIREPQVEVFVAKALRNIGVILGRLERDDEKLRVYDELISDFSRSTVPVVCAQVASAMFSKGPILGELGREEDELDAYDELVSTFGDTEQPTVGVWVVMALVNKGTRLLRMGRTDEAAAARADLSTRFSGSKEAWISAAIKMGNHA